MTEVVVELGARSYGVHIGPQALDRLAGLVGEREGRVAVVSSPRIWALHGRRVQRALGGAAGGLVTLVADGERHKSAQSWRRLHDAFLAGKLGRDGLVLALGGGVVGDLAGFAAATYMRGVAWVPIPTTLLAMVDSAVGGKVGINHPRAKNLVGAFHQPRAVIVDPRFLDTLPLREVRSGAYEILKCGLIGDPGLFGLMAGAPPGLEGWSAEDRVRAIAGACRLKAEVVGEDEQEGDRRRVLNLGHTLGHALEAVTGYRRFTHGEAVGWGLVGAVALARGRGLLDPEQAGRILEAVDRLGPRPPVSDLRPKEVLEAVARDKKAKAGRVPFVLPEGIGRVVIDPRVEVDAVRAALAFMAARDPAPRRLVSSRRRPSARPSALSARGGGSRPRRRPPTAGRR